MDRENRVIGSCYHLKDLFSHVGTQVGELNDGAGFGFGAVGSCLSK